MTSKKINFQTIAAKLTKTGSSTSAVTLSVLLTTASSWAQSNAPGTEMKPPAGTTSAMTAKELMQAFTKADVNKDGKLSKIKAEGVPG